jgi:5-methylcytosine-specific restriction protein A
VRAVKVQRDPFCEICHEGLAVGRQFGGVVHHVVPLPDGARLNFANLRSLCRPCHGRVHAALERWARERAGTWADPAEVWGWCLDHLVHDRVP